MVRLSDLPEYEREHLISKALPPMSPPQCDAGLQLLMRTERPVLEDYPEDAPQVAIEHAPVCPVSFRADESFCLVTP